MQAGWSLASAPLETLRGFKQVSGLDVHHTADGRATLFVADAQDHSVQCFSAQQSDGGGWELSWTVGGGGDAGDGEYRLNTPLGVEFDAARG